MTITTAKLLDGTECTYSIHHREDGQHLSKKVDTLAAILFGHATNDSAKSHPEMLRPDSFCTCLRVNVF